MRAQRFELVDASGTVRAGMSITPDGRPVIALLDEAGRFRVGLAQNQEREYGVIINDAQGTPRFGVGTTARGFVGLNVRDGSGTIRANLYATDDGAATGFQSWDAEGQVRAALGILPSAGEFGVVILGADGVPLRRAP